MARAAPPFWIVADMDGTLVSKPGFTDAGKYRAPRLSESPVMAPLMRWLRAGGRLLMVTSDDGDAPVFRVWDCIPAELRRSVLLSTSDGAALWRAGEGGRCEQDAEYARHALRSAGGKLSTTGLPNQHMDRLLDIARGMHLRFFADLLEEKGRGRGGQGVAGIWEHLDRAHQKYYEKVLDRAADGELLEDVLSMDAMMHFGRVMPGTLLWRNQPGPREQWAGYREPAGTKASGWAGRIESWRGLCETVPGALYTNLIVMGIPRAVAGRYLTPAVEQRLGDLGVSGSAAPNSIWLKNAAVDKSLPVQYLAARAPGGAGVEEGPFSKARALAFGDNPGGNDGPLTRFVREGMRFVSVAPAPEETPAEVRGCHVGGLEAGTATVVSEMAGLLELGRLEPLFEGSGAVERLAAQCRAELQAAARPPPASRH